MATKVYANLIGEWVDLSTDDSCVMGPHMTSPDTWWEENAKMYSPITKQEADTFYQQDYLLVHYKGVDYRLQPSHIQIIGK